MWNAGAMTVHRITFVGPAALAVGVATELADADAIDLTSSARPTAVDDTTVRLDLSVEGSIEDVRRAVARIDADLPRGASIEITGS
jgi:hypothetical protein